MIFGTVVTASHWPKAKLLAASIRRSMPSAKLVVCLVERTMPEKIRKDSTGVADIWLARKLRGAGDFDKRIFRYEPFEACCAVKPLLLDELMARYPEEDRFVLIDSDVEVFSPFAEVRSLLADHPVLLTTHNLNHEVPPSRYDYSLLFGIYNAGVLATNRSEEARRFVDWWISRTHRDCLFDVGNGLFAEQRWLNLAPIYFRAHVLKHPGYNVAVWNLHERDVTRSEQGEWLVNGEPLRCFHYHGLADLVHDCKKGQFKHRLALCELVLAYAATALKNNPTRDEAKAGWSYGQFESGEKIEKESRRVYAGNIGYEQLPMSPFALSNRSFEL